MRAEAVRQHRPALTTRTQEVRIAPQRICAIAGCNKLHAARGWCKSHYYRWRDHGDPVGGRTPYGEPERFLQDSITSATDECLPWPYGTNGNGYGIISRWPGQRRSALVHRIVCEEAHGPPSSADAQAAHSCGNRLCCNPRHLRWDTATGNHADKLVHGTHNRGARHGRAKLTPQSVRTIRSLDGRLPHTRIAERFGVSQPHVSAIIRRKEWVWLK